MGRLENFLKYGNMIFLTFKKTPLKYKLKKNMRMKKIFFLTLFK